MARQIAGDRTPRAARSGRHQKNGLEVIGAMAVDGNVRRLAIVMRRLDLRNVKTLRFRGRDVGPCAAVFSGDMDEPVVGPRPKEALLERRLSERDDGAVRLSFRADGRGLADVAR